MTTEQPPVPQADRKVAYCQLGVMFNGGQTYLHKFPTEQRPQLSAALLKQWADRHQVRSAGAHQELHLGEPTDPTCVRLDLWHWQGFWFEDVYMMQPPSPSPDEQAAREQARQYQELMAEYFKESIKFFRRSDEGDDWKDQDRA